MKKIASWVLLLLSGVAAISDIFFLVYGWAAVRELAATPGTSGIDYLGLGWGLGICLLAISFLGLLFGSGAVILCENKILRTIAACQLALFALLFYVGFFVLFI